MLESPQAFRVFARKLDRGTPNPGNIGGDFTRLGVPFWSNVLRDDARSKVRQSKLDELSQWRNAIAHQDFESAKLRPASLTLPIIRGWRGACNGLARSFDRVMGRYIEEVSGRSPW
jgi:hypothetical protein